MLARFQGRDGAKKLLEAVHRQRLLTGLPASAAMECTRKGKLEGFANGEMLIEQNGGSDHIYFILTGTSEIHVNGRAWAIRYPDECVGDMAAIDPKAPRSATVKAKGPVVALRLKASQLIAIANKYPRIWRNAAEVVASRLRQRMHMHRKPNSPPVMFIGSSVEGLAVAKQIKVGLDHEDVQCRVWTNGIFGPSRYPMEDLLSEVQDADFAVFVFGPDDKIASRNKTYVVPRDNVIFEMGLFLGRLGRERVFVVQERSKDLKIPSDLTGVTPMTYKVFGGAKWPVILGTICTSLSEQVKLRGPA
jgi:predicted nucleotide-binding protein